MKQLDFGLVILRPTEAIAVALGFAKAMKCPIETTKLSFFFRWTEMKGRELSSWASVISAISEYVYQVTKTVFEAFSGIEIDISSVEDLTQKLIERHL